MAQAEIGALRVRLAANAGEFKKGMRQAGNSLQRFSKRVGLTSRNVNRAMKAMGAATAAAIAAIGVAVGKALGHIDQLMKLSRAIGVPVKQLSAFEHAAELSGVALDKLGRGFRNVARNAQLAVKGPTDFSRSLDMINVAWRETDGSFVRADKLMLRVADKFANMEDGAEKTAIAMKTFGEEVGPRLIPLLNQGSDGIQQMLDRAEQLGLVFDQKTGRAAEKFNDTLTDFRRQISGVVTQLTAKLLPSLQFLVDMFSDLGNQKAVVDALVSGFRGFVRIVLTLVNTFSRLKAEIVATAQAIGQAFTGDFTGAMQTFNEGQQRSIELQKQLNNQLFKFQTMNTGTGVEAGTGRQQGEKNRGAIDKILFGDEGKDKLTEGLGDFKTSIEDLNSSAMAGEGQAKTFGNTWASNIDFIRKRSGMMASDLSSALSSIFGESKAVAIAQALINTYQGISRAIAAYPPPLSGIMAGVQAAAGFAQVANIRSQSKKGGGSGSSAAASGGAAAAGQAGQAAQQAAGARQGINLTIQGDTFGREHFFGLIDGLNDALDDGAQLNVQAA